MNRRHMTGDHRGRTAGEQLCWPEPWMRFSAQTGWYADGGTSLNTPLKPALASGAGRLIVIGLNLTTGSPRSTTKRPADAFDGAAQVVQALLANQLAHDVATLATINQMTAARQPASRARAADQHRVILYIFVAPRERFAVGRLASTICRRRYAGLRGMLRAPSLELRGRLLDAAGDPAHGELFSYVFFAPEFAAALIEEGRQDAQWRLKQEHHGGPWRVANPPGAESDPA
jgi:NTE family protein